MQPEDQRTHRPEPASRDWTRRTALLAVLIFLGALTLRLLYLQQAAAVPFSSMPIIDGASYWAWAGRIAAGDWQGEGVFYQAPLYPYLLAVVRTLFGPQLGAVYVLQATLSSLGCVLLYLAGRRLFSPAAGLLAGFMAACYPPSVFYDGVLQKEALAVFLMSALLGLVVLLRTRVRPGLSAALGLVLGLLALLRENTLLIAPVLLAWLWVKARGTPPVRRWLGPSCLALGMALVLVPVGLRNLVVGGEFALTTSQMGTNFYIGNNPAADGSYIALRPGRGAPEFEKIDATALAGQALGRAVSPGEVSRYWLGQAVQFIRTDPGAWLRLMGRKTLLFFGAYEVPDAEDLYFYQRWSWLLRGLDSVWNFGVLLPLAAAGACLTWPRRRELRVLHAMVLAMSAGVILFFVFGRYRLPMVPVLMLFAAAGLVAGAEAFRERRWRPLAVAALALVATALLARQSVFDPQQRLAGSFYNWAYVLTQAGRTEEALEVNRETLRLDPNLAEAHYNLATLLAKRKQFPEAIREFRAAIGLRSAYPEAWNNLGITLAMTGDRRGAADAFIRALEEDPRHAGARANLERTLRAAVQADERELQARIEGFLRGWPAGN